MAPGGGVFCIALLPVTLVARESGLMWLPFDSSSHAQVYGLMCSVSGAPQHLRSVEKVCVCVCAWACVGGYVWVWVSIWVRVCGCGCGCGCVGVCVWVCVCAWRISLTISRQGTLQHLDNVGGCWCVCICVYVCARLVYVDECTASVTGETPHST